MASMSRDFLKTLGRSDEYVLTDKGTGLPEPDSPTTIMQHSVTLQFLAEGVSTL